MLAGTSRKPLGKTSVRQVDLQQVLLNGVDETVELQEGVTITYLDPNARQATTQAQVTGCSAVSSNVLPRMASTAFCALAAA